MWIPVLNYQGITVRLEAGTVLGVASRANLVRMEDTIAEPDLQEEGQVNVPSRCATMDTLPVTPERVDGILTQLALPMEMLTEQESGELKALVDEFADVFALNDTELGCTDRPIQQQPYHTPVVCREMVTEMIKQMEDQGIIRPSSSPWANPIVFVPKKDGKTRVCVDYRRLNAITKKDVFPLPQVDDILDALGGAKYFSSLDLLSGYWQIGLDDEAKQRSAFTTYDGLYEFVRMPFGCNDPATFQRLSKC